MMNNLFESMNIALSMSQYDKLEKYYSFLIDENEKYNLTAITERKDVFIKHFLDSMLIKNSGVEVAHKTIIDIGIGAGFPSIPIKILEPSIKVTGLDSLNKRITFLNQLVQVLELDHCAFIHGRAEDFGQDSQYREGYDIAVSRAVAELRLLLELVMPFVKINGYFIAYKSIKTKTELDDAQNAFQCMKSELVEVQKVILPDGYGERDLLIIQKRGKIEKKYPRKPGVPKKNPL
ncbi:16S rRNA (guanine(527)-N(7))-methyltransferase RsmG [Fusibacter sp. 3D3]|uniref:16S rRNA (guanine(527)-N(7))-methyltransferase RsmG n=1 Tax=Fusibacter sp. 3D3 TaxID=1048380 RepID=UPI000853F053|nr:16S rRNA (guanine(527)-N(7))-methyltransferase RsmG [Fusibacter sp. 3D3]GAU75783.1 rRNA small subunit 7-methylguanosine methyltransferase GidB [Fusibacter sp. 3D3]